MAQIDDLNAAVAAAQQAVNDLMTRDAQVVAGVQALQAEVSNLEQQVAAGTAPDLSGVTAAVNQLAATVATADTEPTDIPQQSTPPTP